MSSLVPDRRALALAVALCLSLLHFAGPAAAADPVADLRVDANRDGTVDVLGDSDDAGEDDGKALYLANIDDDSQRCPKPTRDTPDEVLAGCNDAADDIVNGAADALDLARVQSVPIDVPAGATGTIAVTGDVRVFVQVAGEWQPLTPDTTFDAAALQAGLTLGVEGLQPRSPSTTPTAELTLTVDQAGQTTSDSATLGLAALVTHNHLQATDSLMVMKPMGPASFRQEQERFNADLARLAAGAGVTDLKLIRDEFWVQDFVEPMYAVMPGPEGPQTMRVLLRSDQPRAQWDLYSLRGPDVAVHWLGQATTGDTVDSFGNLETIPPYPGHPAGRIILGSQRAIGLGHPTERLRTFLGAQQAGLDPLMLNTSFLHVGHVDEFVQFLPADTERGWRVAIADPRAGLGLLRRAVKSGLGDKKLLRGDLTDIGAPDPSRQASGEAPPVAPGGGVVGDEYNPTVRQALRSKKWDLVRHNRRAAKAIRVNLQRIKAATGVTSDEIVRVPVLFTAFKRPDGKPAALGALVPDAVNNIVLGDQLIVATQFTVRTKKGKDLFGSAVRKAYGSAGYDVKYLADKYYHFGGGEVHCGTNTLRAMPVWW